MDIRRFDHHAILFLRKISTPTARISLFVVFFWFGILKVFGESPASPLVQALFERTIPFMSFSTFMIVFGLFEMLIGILFLIPKATREVIPLLVLHMFTTIMPLFLLTDVTWTGWFVPTMEGQYIIKNIVLIAVAIGIASHMVPLDEIPYRKNF